MATGGGLGSRGRRPDLLPTLALWPQRPSRHAGGELPVAPSAIAAEGQFFLPTGRVPYPVPRELAADEIPAIIEGFGRAAGLAKEAGFDGVELHGAFGYLQDQFLRDGSNKRIDGYDGGIANRARLMLETKLSLSNRMTCTFDSDAHTTFGHVIAALDAMRVGYLYLSHRPGDRDGEDRPCRRDLPADDLGA